MGFIERAPQVINTENQPIQVNYKLLPKEAVTEVVINDEARSILPSSAHYLLDENNLIQMRVFTVPPKRDPNVRLRSASVSYQEGRTIPVLHFDEPAIYHGGIATFVSAKGVNLSGKHYDDLENIRKESDPIGFFGDTDCISDIKGSNLFLSEGGRAALTLGYLVIDPKKFKNVIKGNWKKYNYPEILNRIEKVESNGDNLAILLRLGGTRHRLGHTNKSAEEKYLRQHYTSIRNEFRKGADLLLQSIDTSAFRDYLHLGNVNKCEVTEAFEAVRDHATIDDKQINVINGFLSGFSRAEATKLAKAIVKSGYYQPLFLYPDHSGPKDTDTTLMTCDFEAFGLHYGVTHADDVREIKSLPASCARWGAGIVFHYFQNLKDLNYIRKSYVPNTYGDYVDEMKAYIKKQINFSY